MSQTQKGSTQPGIQKGALTVAASREVAEATVEPLPTPPRSLQEMDQFNRLSRVAVLGSFILVVVAPACLVFWFLSNEASPRFQTEFRVAVRSLDVPRGVGGEGLMSLAGLATPASNESQSLVQYLESRAMVDFIERQPDISFDALYADPAIDFLSAAEPEAPVEDRLEHWNRFVRARYETTSNTVIVTTTAFSPEDTLLVSRLLLSEASTFVNDLSLLARVDAMEFAQAEVAKAEQNLRAARQALSEFQEKEQVIDPREALASTLSIIAGLREQLTERKILLASQRVGVSADSYLVEKTLSQIAVLEAEIASLQSSATLTTPASGGEGRPLTEVLREFDALVIDIEFAELSYTSALASLEAARVEASRQELFLATIVEPGLPEAASFPNPVRGTAIAFVIALALWSIGLIGVQIVREHA